MNNIEKIGDTQEVPVADNSVTHVRETSRVEAQMMQTEGEVEALYVSIVRSSIAQEGDTIPATPIEEGEYEDDELTVTDPQKFEDDEIKEVPPSVWDDETIVSPPPEDDMLAERLLNEFPGDDSEIPTLISKLK